MAVFRIAEQMSRKSLAQLALVALSGGAARNPVQEANMTFVDVSVADKTLR